MKLSLSAFWLWICYQAKAPLPQTFELALRQALARHKLKAVKEIWPILESAAKPPPGWEGWPENKTFALVLTHDVDTRRGLDHCLPLAEIEERLGFRSCFNFVPEKRYVVPAELLKELVARGFEVGVHGLYHDAYTFMSRRVFERRAPLINQKIKEWQATGFRAPSMIRNLNWIRELDVEYDTSTFDTDPFEPQPEGVGTIFPFWIEGLGHRPGYVELPYTLAQDHTLFVLLQMANTNLWKRKLDWIAETGGMALLNSHPDYMIFNHDENCRPYYPVERYQSFLEHLSSRYQGHYWHVLPREMARFWAQKPERIRPRSQKRICMMAYSFYDNDNRIIRYAEALAGRGDTVDSIGLRAEGKPQHGHVNGVSINRIQQRQRDEKSPVTYLIRILKFWIKSSFVVSWNHLKNPYDLIHIHSVPDFEVFAAWLPKLLGTKVILDIHDLVPEFYLSKFQATQDSLSYRLLLKMEQASTRFADHVIAANDIWFNTLTTRAVPPNKCSSFVNYLDLTMFYPHARNRNDHKFVIVYPGGFQWHQGVDIAIKAFAQIMDQIPNSEFNIYGDGPEKGELERLIQQLGLESRVQMKGPRSLDAIPEILANTDLGIVPKRANSFGNEAYSTKILEYMSQGVPVIASRTAIDTHYFKDSAVQFFDSGNEHDLAQAILKVAQNEELRHQLIENGFEYVQKYRWDLKKKDYFNLVDSLTNENT